MEKKINAAVSHGVNVFIYDWYWYDGKPFLENGLDSGFLKAKNNHKMRFYLMWANHDHTSYLDYTNPDKSKVYWYGGVDTATFHHMIVHIINDYFKKPNYYKINGEPVFSIYEISNFIKGIGGMKAAEEALAYFTKKTKEAGFPGLHLQGVLWSALPSSLSAVPGDSTNTQNNTVLDLGLKSLINYQWCHYVPLKRYDLWGAEAIQGWYRFSKEFTIPFLPSVSIGWDPNPRYPDKIVGMVKGRNPKDFKKFLLNAKQFLAAHPKYPTLITQI